MVTNGISVWAGEPHPTFPYTMWTKLKGFDVLNNETIVDEASNHGKKYINSYIETLKCIDDLKKVREFRK